MGKVYNLENCSPELTSQFDTALGAEFSLNALRKSVLSKNTFNEARGVINTFNNQLDTQLSMNATHESTRFYSRCEPDIDESSEIADYDISPLDSDYFDKEVRIIMSPNAIKALYSPMKSIIMTISPNTNEPLVDDNNLAYIAFKSIYSKTLAQYMVMQQLLEVHDDASQISKYEQIVDNIYEQKFGNDGINDFVVRTDRLAMSLGGSVMYRLAASELDKTISNADFAETQRIGQLMKMYAAGIAKARTDDQQRVTFPLVHAFAPMEASKFLKFWFS